jgi:hypothetical protein
MNIKEALLQEHSKAQMQKIVAYIGNDKKRFAELITLMLTADIVWLNLLHGQYLIVFKSMKS